MDVVIRSEQASDAGAIEAVTAAAFRGAARASGTESAIVRELRTAGQLSVSLVAERAGGIVGHVAASPVAISGQGQEAGWYGLGPVSVAPSAQGQGIGTRLIHEALTALRAMGAAGCVVLGEPGYYGRFGFRAEGGLILPGVPPAYFQALAFERGVPTGVVAYHEAFGAEG
ncbi:MAG: N-acetyltransferase [Phycisphaeraceae bacterium]